MTRTAKNSIVIFSLLIALIPTIAFGQKLPDCSKVDSGQCVKYKNSVHLTSYANVIYQNDVPQAVVDSFRKNLTQVLFNGNLYSLSKREYTLGEWINGKTTSGQKIKRRRLSDKAKTDLKNLAKNGGINITPPKK